ncbi:MULTISPECIES: VOC family protein [unclassified Achromobacter]|uniref:VOC family protein n=1 Tax=unclassified Achromobacter TaxID=2626865 RepID=UPI000B5195EC|nr:MULTISPECIES: VOC family protein [unclassified Achromobacter]OWT73731.1 4-hydroxyphenylpyruvate dioxygenase [Achromobacter sp. HZ34]OWT79353.1 4-hydroxyphenylpyruvate dioxygenase [Achromobacter sp. HZ28]
MKFIATLAAALAVIAAPPSHAAGVQAVGIDHVGINVPDLKQAEAFFSRTFGCMPVTHIGPFKLDAGGTEGNAKFAPRADSVSLAMLRCGTGSNVELFEYRNSKGSLDMPKAEDIGASHIAFYTADIKGAVAYLKSQGITVLGEPITMPSGDTEGETWVHFRSPWGSEMELVSYPKGKGYEKHSKVKLWNPNKPAN